MSQLFVNCRRVPFSKTLGVAHALLQLTRALSDRHEVVFVVPDAKELDASPSGASVRNFAEVIEFATAKTNVVRKEGIEILPHQFQPPELCSRSVMMCHDMHVFDIPWKYGDRAGAIQRDFRRNVTAASAVVAHFPRTYYDLEFVAGVSVMNLFLTESPLLFDTSPAFGRTAPAASTHLLFPAQLQAHKNHAVLVRAVARLAAEGHDIVVQCPGSDFDDATTLDITGLISSLGVDERVQLLGRVDDEVLLDLYGTSHGVVIPSAAEGGAYIALEAIAAGRPVAVNRIRQAELHLAACSAEVMWFDADDDDSVVDALRSLAAANARSWVERNHRARAAIAAMSWARVAETWSGVIAMLEGGARPTLATDHHAASIEYS